MNIPSTRRRIALVVSAAVLVLSPVTLAAQAGGATSRRGGDLTQILSPRDGALVTVDGKGAVTVRVRTSRNVRVFQAFIGLTPVTNTFSRPRHGIRTATFKVGKALRLGQNTLTIKSSGATRSDFDDATFTVARRHGGLLSVSARQALFPRQLVRVVLKLSTTDYQLRATLNGQSVASRFAPGVKRTAAALDVDDGLRYGRNTLVITAIHGRSYDRVTRTFSVRRVRALVGAGQDRRARMHDPVRLDASRSRPASQSDELRFHWRVVRRPRGSSGGRLENANSAKPTFVPDVNGTFRLQLTAREVGGSGDGKPMLAGSPSSTDTVTVASQPDDPPSGALIETIPTLENGITLDGQTLVSGGNWIQMLVLDRGTREVMPGTGTYDIDELGKFKSAIKKVDSSELLVLTGEDNQAQLSSDWVQELQSVYQQFGGTLRPFGSYTGANAFSGGEWSLIGIQGTQKGQAAQNFLVAPPGQQPGSLYGYLQRDTNQNYTFNFSQYVPFDTNVPGVGATQNRIQIGSPSTFINPKTNVNETFTSQALAPGQSGYHVVVLSQLTLQKLHEGTFATNDASGQIASGVVAFGDFLNNLPDYPSIVIVQSIGDPQALSNTWVQYLAPQIAKVGGTEDVFNQRGGYTLVGGLHLPGGAGTEMSTSFPGSDAPARLAGVLHPNRQGQYDGTTSDQTGKTSYDMYQIASQTPGGWPVPSSPAQQQAMSCIASNWPATLGTTDVRVAYWKLPLKAVPGTLSTGDAAIAADKCHPGIAFNASICDGPLPDDDVSPVYCALISEIPKVTALAGYFSSLQSKINSQEALNQANLHMIGRGIRNAVNPPPQADSGKSFVDITAEVLRIAALAGDVEGYGPAMGAAASGLQLANDLNDDTAGNTASAAVQSAAINLQIALGNRMSDLYTSMQTAYGLLVSDHDRLFAADQARPAWEQPGANTQYATALSLSLKAWFYRSLMPVAYDVYVVPAANPTGCQTITGINGINGRKTYSDTFPGAPSFSWINFLASSNYQVVQPSKILSQPLNHDNVGQPPSAGVVGQMFNPKYDVNGQQWVGLVPQIDFNHDFQVNELQTGGQGVGDIGC